MTSYYNEIDPFCAQWLRELIADGLIAAGDVDERDIREVEPDDVRGYTQCHFFAGIGGWSYALRLAGWDDARPVWTGSCPCQPFSVAGKGKGSADERHLWPDFYRLIRECRPAAAFGEQVASPLGRKWLAGVRVDLEALEYAVGGADLCAAGVSAPHIRQRLWWVAYAHGERWQPRSPSATSARHRDTALATCCDGDLRNRRMGDTYSPAATRQRQICIPMESEQKAGRSSNADAWSRAKFIGCADGKARRVEPGIQPLSYGFPNRVGTLRGAGNAIVPQIAAEFIKACNL